MAPSRKDISGCTEPAHDIMANKLEFSLEYLAFMPDAK
jgi:hypothetical protein